MRARVVLACCLLAACGGGGGGLSEEEAEDVVDDAVEAAADETGFEEDETQVDLVDLGEDLLECAGDAEQLADSSVVLTDPDGGDDVAVVAIAFEDDADRVIADALQDDAADCMEDAVADQFEDLGSDADVELDVEEGDDVGDASASIEVTVDIVSIEIGLDVQVASQGQLLVLAASTADELDLVDVVEAGLEALEG